MSIATTFNLTIEAVEQITQNTGFVTKLTHKVQHATAYATGTSASQNDIAYSTKQTLSASALALDLAGSLTTADGSTITFAKVTAIFIKNNSTTTTEIITIGAGSNPLVGIWGATGDASKVGPGGDFIWTSPVDGVPVVATTGDILTIDPGAFNIEVEILILGRSA